MINKRYTDEEIIAHLKCCAESNNCKGCVYSKHCDGEEHLINAIDLINHQKSEIERLRAKVETQTQEKLALGRIYTQKLKTVKYETFYEAYKEFAERIRECCDLNNDLSTDAWLSVIADINCVLKEMVGE